MTRRARAGPCWSPAARRPTALAPHASATGPSPACVSLIGLRRSGVQLPALRHAPGAAVRSPSVRHRRRPGLERRLPAAASYARSLRTASTRRRHESGRDHARGSGTGRVAAHPGELGQARHVGLSRRRRRRRSASSSPPTAPPRATSGDWPVPYDVLGINLTAAMTFLLICSSVTMVKALEWLGKGDRRALQMFLFLTALGGAIFVSLQAYEWTHLIHRGLHINGNPWGASLFGTTFFLITGFHGLHVTAGVIYLLAILGWWPGGPIRRPATTWWRSSGCTGTSSTSSGSWSSPSCICSKEATPWRLPRTPRRTTGGRTTTRTT